MTDAQHPDSRRITVNLTGRAVTAMDSTAHTLGVSRTDVVSRALLAYAWIVEQDIAGYAVGVQSGWSELGPVFMPVKIL
jgi:hypothetical protein